MSTGRSASGPIQQVLSVLTWSASGGQEDYCFTGRPKSRAGSMEREISMLDAQPLFSGLDWTNQLLEQAAQAQELADALS